MIIIDTSKKVVTFDLGPFEFLAVKGGPTKQGRARLDIDTNKLRDMVRDACINDTGQAHRGPFRVVVEEVPKRE